MPLRILIIDDDESIGRALSREFREFGFELRTASSGAELSIVLQTFAPEVAIVDLHVGTEYGPKLFELVRQRVPNCGAVVLTGLPEMVTPRLERFSVTKPWDRLDMLRRVLQAAEPRRRLPSTEPRT